jgi:5-methylcytosine-specific restriction endonuclease McrA
MDNSRILMLNSSYLPLGVVTWMKAVRLLWQGKAHVVAETDRVIRSPSTEMKLPSIIRMITNVFVTKTRIRLNRKNVFMRDGYTCQYCGLKFEARHLNLDHVVPISKGGKRIWSNIVTACISDNTKKGSRTPSEAGMELLSKPSLPNWTIFDTISSSINGVVPTGWKDYLPSFA